MHYEINIIIFLFSDSQTEVEEEVEEDSGSDFSEDGEGWLAGKGRAARKSSRSKRRGKKFDDFGKFI